VTTFVGISADDPLDVDAYYRVVIEKKYSLAPTILFRSEMERVYTRMFAVTQRLVPVSPDPITPGSDATSYVVDIALVDAGASAGLTARQAVGLIEGLAGTGLDAFYEQRVFGVREFIALDGVADVRDNGSAERQALQDQTETQKRSENPLKTAGEVLVLIVIAIAALAVIQISKDL
jgi:hypothetical protein